MTPVCARSLSTVTGLRSAPAPASSPAPAGAATARDPAAAPRPRLPSRPWTRPRGRARRRPVRPPPAGRRPPSTLPSRCSLPWASDRAWLYMDSTPPAIDGSADQRLPGGGTGLGPPARVGVEQQEIHRTGRQPAGPDGDREPPGQATACRPRSRARTRAPQRSAPARPGLTGRAASRSPSGMARPVSAASSDSAAACRAAFLLLPYPALPSTRTPSRSSRGPGAEPVARRRLGDLHGGDTQPLGLESHDGDRHRGTPDDRLHRQPHGPRPTPG